MKEHTKSWVERAKYDIETNEIRVSKVILYGSYAHGHPDEWSEVDIAVISPDFDNLDQWERQGLLGRKRLGCDLALEALGYGSEGYENAHHLTFLGEIQRMGEGDLRSRVSHFNIRSPAAPSPPRHTDA